MSSGENIGGGTVTVVEKKVLRIRQPFNRGREPVDYPPRDLIDTCHHVQCLRNNNRIDGVLAVGS